MQALKSKPPEQWRVEVDAISDPDVRNRVACLVWWDHFGSRPIGRRLNKYNGRARRLVTSLEGGGPR